MKITRRRLCSAAVVAAVGASGCLDGSSSDSADGSTGDDSASDGSETGELEGELADWAWAGTLPVDSVVQHHDPTCGCCAEYVAYLEAHDVDVRVEETDDLDAVKADHSIPEDAHGCHTVEVGEYLVEGHVPLEAVDELLAEEPDVHGISAPGMPQRSPGMGPRGDDPLSIYAFEESDESDEITEFTEV